MQTGHRYLIQFVDLDFMVVNFRLCHSSSPLYPDAQVIEMIPRQYPIATLISITGVIASPVNLLHHKIELNLENNPRAKKPSPKF